MLCISVVNKLTLYTDTFLMVVLALPISCQIYIDLEVDIDPLLKFDTHMNKIIGKAYSRIGDLFERFASEDSKQI